MASFFQSHKQLLSYLGVFLGGLLIGVLSILIIFTSNPNEQASIIHAPTGQGVYTNPVLDCELYPDSKVAVYKELEKNIVEIISEAQRRNSASHVSVYYRDLNSGAWFGVNEKEEFSPASLLKVPIMIAYLKFAEKDPTILSKQIEYQKGASAQGISLSQNIAPTVALETGKMYSVHDVLSAMIIDSDNDAQYLLVTQLPIELFDQIYYDLGVKIPGVSKLEDFMTVHEYASFFRILYNATYLNREMSERALALLTEVEYDRGIRPGVPANVQIAHKFGERGLLQEDGSEIKQLHDCGIVYLPGRPYLICVMTRGEDFDKQSQVIQSISKEIFNYITNTSFSTSSINSLDSN